MYCQKCGSKVTDGSMFCHVCGEKIAVAEQIHANLSDKTEQENLDNTNQQSAANAGRQDEKKSNSFAVASLVLGILGIIFPFFVLSILAIVFSGVSAKYNGDKKSGMAMAGFVLGWISLAVSIVVVVIVIIAVTFVFSTMFNPMFYMDMFY